MNTLPLIFNLHKDVCLHYNILELDGTRLVVLKTQKQVKILNSELAQ